MSYTDSEEAPLPARVAKPNMSMVSARSNVSGKSNVSMNKSGISDFSGNFDRSQVARIDAKIEQHMESSVKPNASVFNQSNTKDTKVSKNMKSLPKEEILVELSEMELMPVKATTQKENS